MLMTIPNGGLRMLNRVHCLIAVVALTAATAAAQPTVTSLSPAPNHAGAATNSDLTAGFSSAMANPSAGDIRVHSNLRGWLTGSLSGGGTSNLTFDPSS